MPDPTQQHVVGVDFGTLSARALVVRADDGSWNSRYLTTIDARMAKVKLDLVWEAGGLTMDARQDGRVVFRKIDSGFRLFGKKEANGLEVVVELPDTKGGVGEVSVCGRILGSPKQDFIRNAEQVIPALFAEIRAVLNNVKERRKHPRLAAEFPVTLYPLRSDGALDEKLSGRCVDVSAGGLAIRTEVPPHSKYCYVEFEKLPGTEGLALLVQTIKAHATEGGVIVTGRYRTDL